MVLPARPIQRSLAGAIDMGVLALLFVPIYLLDFVSGSFGQGRVWASLTTLYLFVWLFVFAFYDTYAIAAYGQTLGQKLAHVRVHSDDGGHLSFEKAVMRKALSVFVLPIAWELIDKEGRGLHDYWTDAVVESTVGPPEVVPSGQL